MADASTFASQMIGSLAVSDPELDTSIGSTTRKIIDAVAETAARASLDSHLLNYQFDIDSKVGADLDDFAVMFGISRLAAQRATGLVTFSRPSAAATDILIPAGTQVATGTSPQVVFATVAPSYITAGTSTAEVPVQALLGGESGNLTAASLTLLATPVDGISATTTNSVPTSGGVNTEPDSAFVARFKKTVFRSMAGTEDMYLGAVLEGAVGASDVESPTQAVVLGATRRWREQVQIAGGGTATSTIPAGNASYIFPDSSVLGADIDTGQILTPGVHYTFDPTVNPPTITAIGGALVVGDLYDLEFEYSSNSSRNDPTAGITNRVDVWCNGVMPVVATEATFFRSTSVFASSGPLDVDKFVRLNSPGTNPVVGNVFVRLAYGPILAFPNSLTVAGTTYLEGTDYWVVHDDTAFGYGPTSLFGLEWLGTHVPPENAAITLSGASAYTYNRVPRDAEDRVRRWRLVGTDARVHAAKQVYLRVNLAVMFDYSFDREQVTTDVERALAQFFDGAGFDAKIQASDILQTVHNVFGVDNVRFLTSDEPITVGKYAIERVSDDGDRISYVTAGSAPARAADLYLGDNEIPVLHTVNLVAKAANTYGVL